MSKMFLGVCPEYMVAKNLPRKPDMNINEAVGIVGREVAVKVGAEPSRVQHTFFQLPENLTGSTTLDNPMLDGNYPVIVSVLPRPGETSIFPPGYNPRAISENVSKTVIEAGFMKVLEEALEEQTKQNRNALNLALEQERKRSEKASERERERNEKALERERERSKKELDKALDRERKKAQQENQLLREDLELRMEKMRLTHDEEMALRDRNEQRLLERIQELEKELREWRTRALEEETDQEGEWKKVGSIKNDWNFIHLRSLLNLARKKLAGQETWEEFSARGDIEVKISQEIASTSLRPLSPEMIKEVCTHFDSQCRVRQKANRVAHLVETTSIKSALESQGITEKEKEALGFIFNFVFPEEAVSVE